jgi:uncharacterized membrane protein
VRGRRRLRALVRHDSPVTSDPRAPLVLPTLADPVVAGGSEAVGGPEGRRARWGAGWWTAVRVLLLLAMLGYAAGYLLDVPCMRIGWASPDRYQLLCYTDIQPLYSLRGFADGYLPYLQVPPGGEALEYPVLTGLFMQIAAWVTLAVKKVVPDADGGIAFFNVNVVLLAPFLLAAVAATALTVRRRPWDAALVALAPGMILAATINWDLIAVALTAISLALWAHRREGWAGIFLGLAIATKFYPLVLLGPWLLLSLRAGRMRQFATLVGGAAAAWLVVNVPVMIASFDGWSRFYVFSKERGQDFGSVWLAENLLGGPRIPDGSLNLWVTGSLVALCLGIAWLCVAARHRPRLAQVLFLVVAAFAVTNKVYSPQYVIWLIPLAALARPRWRDFLVWQTAEVAYFMAIWWYLVTTTAEDGKGMTQQWYGAATFLHVVVTLWFAGLVVRDIWWPRHDPVRTDGQPDDEDDPGGGCLDRAADVVVLPPARRGATPWTVPDPGPPPEPDTNPTKDPDRADTSTEPSA